MFRQIRVSILLLISCSFAYGKVVVFWQAGFPAIESQPMAQTTLNQALQGMGPVYAGIDEIQKPETLANTDLLVLPYGSALPADAWKAILAYIQGGGNLLTLGGRALWVPVSRQEGKFVAGRPQNTYSRRVGIWHTYEVPQSGAAKFAWDDDFSFFPQTQVHARKVYAPGLWSGSGSYRGLGFLVNSSGEKIASPVTRQDFVILPVTREEFSSMRIPEDYPALGARHVFLNFEPEPGYWSSADGVRLIRTAAQYASQGATLLWVETLNATVVEGEIPQFVIHLRNVRKQRLGQSLRGTIDVQLMAGDKQLESATIHCSGDTVSRNIVFRKTLPPGFYTVRALYKEEDAIRETYRSGFWSRDEKLLSSGAPLTVGRDYFRKDGAPFVPFGVTYFTTDFYRTGGFAGGNPSVWERDFAEMEKCGVTMVRTGLWLRIGLVAVNADLADLNKVTGGVEERLLRAFEAYLHSAGRHNIRVQVTLFAFNPQAVRRDAAHGHQPVQLLPGTDPYTDAVTLRAQRNYIYSVVNRFKTVPYLSWDVDTEPHLSDLRPRGDSSDRNKARVWNKWIEQRYATLRTLADAWGNTVEELGAFGRIPLPAPDDLQPRRASENQKGVRAFDYNLFSQDMFNRWVGEMISTIRSTGSKQLISVSQDEQGVTNGLLNQFFGGTTVDFTASHTWWLDDALLWDSVAAKRPDKPNLIGETGVQPAWRSDATWRWDERTALGLFERKLALGFAAGNTGVWVWQWERGDCFGIKRGDGSKTLWQEVLTRIGDFARKASPYLIEGPLPEVAIVLPQSLQLSAFNRYAVEAQQKCVRALYHYARSSAYVVGEYQLQLMGTPKLIILPSPWVLEQKAWDTILAKVREGSTLLLSGRFDADEHFRPLDRQRELQIAYQPGLLTSRENLVQWREGQAALTYSADKCTYLERGLLASGETFVEKQLGKGKILYFALPLELNDDLPAIGRIYRFALRRANVTAIYATTTEDPGVLICPTGLKGVTLYVLTSESSSTHTIAFHDAASGKDFEQKLLPGRAALLLVLHNGKVAAAYDPNLTP